MFIVQSPSAKGALFGPYTPFSTVIRVPVSTHASDASERGNEMKNARAGGHPNRERHVLPVHAI